MGASKDDTLGNVDKELVVEFGVGEYIFREGDPGNEMYIVQNGEVEIVALSHGEAHRLAILEEGDFFGEMAILEDLPRTASARAHTPCSLLEIDEGTFNQLIRHNPEISIRMLRKLCHRLRKTNPALLEADGVGLIPDQEPVAAAVASEAASFARLVHIETDTEFALAVEAESTVGRFDPVTGLTPTVNLRPIDTHRSCSRRHARIFTRDNKVFIREEVGTANGTFVNGTRLKADEDVEIHDGDTLGFGQVELVYRAG